MSVHEPMNHQERDTLRTVFRQWGLKPAQADEILRHAVLGPGALGFESEAIGSGVAILVDETRDDELAGLFDWRKRVDDDEFVNQWEAGEQHAAAMVCPHAREAIYAYTVSVARPVELTRTYLLLVSKLAHVLTKLREPGATVWLVPKRVAMREWAREGLGSADDLLSRALPVAEVRGQARGLQLALDHVRRRAR